MPPFEPIDPNFDARVRESLARQRVMQSLGIVLERLVPGEIELVMPYATNLLAPAKGSRFVFHARVVKPGRTITVCDAHAMRATTMARNSWRQ